MVNDVVVTARTRADETSGAAAVGAASDANVGHILTASAPVVLAISPGLTDSIAAISPERIGVAIIASVRVSAGVQVSPADVVSLPLAVGVSTGAELGLNEVSGRQPVVTVGSVPLPGLSIVPVDSLKVTTLGGIAAPNGGVKLYAEFVHPNSPNTIIWVAGLQPNGDIGFKDGTVLNWGSGVDSGFGGAQGLGLLRYVDSRRGEGSPDTTISIRVDNEPQNDVIQGPARSDAMPATTLENSQLAAFLPSQTGFPTEVLDSPAWEAQGDRPTSIDSPAAARQATINGGANERADDSAIASPRTEALLADLLPRDLASLEADIQAFLQEMEQLGTELSSLLARLNLSPWFMAIAVATLAAGIARRRLLETPRRPLLAACEGATFAWFPDFDGPWSAKEL